MSDPKHIAELTDLLEESLETHGLAMDQSRLSGILAKHLDLLPSEWLARIVADRVDELARLGMDAGVYSDLLNARSVVGQKFADDLSRVLVEMCVTEIAVKDLLDHLEPTQAGGKA